MTSHKAQESRFLTGNEAIVEAAKAIDFHVMAYFPITPSTEIAELLDQAKANGEIRTVLIAADGEHGAAGACFGAATGGARVLNATSANGFLYALEQMPVQAGLRVPMVLNLVTRSVSGPLDIRCDHSDLLYAINTGWVILCASTAQEAYDFNALAVKLGEDPEVRLPVMVATDGFFTSHERQSFQVFKQREDLRRWLDQRQDPWTTLDPRRPITVGPYMNDPDLINNKVQLHQAHDRAREVFKTLAQSYAGLSGRSYDPVDSYQMDDAETALVLLNSAAETAKEAVDQLRAQGRRVGVLRPRLLRPFPFEAFRHYAQSVKTWVVGDRADIPGVHGGPLAFDVRAALQEASLTGPLRVYSRIYGLGGKMFRTQDALAMFEDVSTPQAPSFAFVGDMKTEAKQGLPQVLPPLSQHETQETWIEITVENDRPKVHAPSIAHLATKPKRITPGHGACPGCGIFPALDQFFKGIDGDVVVLYHTGCAMVVTTGYPFSAHRVTYVHNLFQNGAPTLSGLVEAFYEKRRRGEIETSTDITFVMITGDGGMDIGLGATLGTASRNHPMIILEYDNQGYMNTGGQLSYATPRGHQTSTSHVGRMQIGKPYGQKDTLTMMAATGIPYAFSSVERLDTDLIEKAAKAQWYARHRGLSFGRVLTSCPLNWGSEESKGLRVVQAAVDCCFFPLVELEQGKTRITEDPEAAGRKIPVAEWLGMMKKTQHLLDPKNAEILGQIQADVDREWARLKARHGHPLL